MRTKQTLILILTVAIVSAVCHASPPAARTANLAAADNDFAFRLLGELAKEQPRQNIFISPYSAATIFQMVDNGAAGRTLSEMRQALDITNLTANEVNAADKTIAESLNTGNTNVILITANAIWYRQGVNVNPAFLKCDRQFFNATVEPLDFGDPHSVNTINSWAGNATDGKINHIADRMIDPRNTRLFLANAVYFNGKWADPFAARDTHDRPFYKDPGSSKLVPMMMKTGTFAYRRGNGYQAVQLPYRGGNLAMYVFLPDTQSSPAALLNILNDPVWQPAKLAGFSEQEGTLVLPKFKMEYSVQLKQPLQALGMKTAFERGQADFSGIGPELYISAALQKTFVSVKESGTEAAAVTAVGITASIVRMPPPHRFNMIVDRPFFFLIKDDQTGTILFIGMVYDPPPAG